MGGSYFSIGLSSIIAIDERTTSWIGAGARSTGAKTSIGGEVDTSASVATSSHSPLEGQEEEQ